MTEHLSHEDFVLAQRAEAARIAQDVLDGRLSVLEGARLIVRGGMAEDDPDFKKLVLVDEEAESLPVGSERRNWLHEALERKAAELVKTEEWAREVAFNALRNIAT